MGALYGTLYLSSKGTWYCWTPSQWDDGHRWVTVSPTEAIEQYGRGLDDEDRTEILRLAGFPQFPQGLVLQF